MPCQEHILPMPGILDDLHHHNHRTDLPKLHQILLFHSFQENNLNFQKQKHYLHGNLLYLHHQVFLENSLVKN